MDLEARGSEKLDAAPSRWRVIFKPLVYVRKDRNLTSATVRAKQNGSILNVVGQKDGW